MLPKFTLPQLKKYDVNQKVILALADAESRAILFSITKKSKSAPELAGRLRIPLSSVYKKLSELQALTLIEVERTVLSDRGRRLKMYRSRIKRADISIGKPEPVLTLVPN
ncbi:MAG: helix-turn-helix domain-containing protein [Thaumarchaeota archaeon]|nr:helix-turn-helix domain-containing protein [Nitrososphaerota archaeon]MDE0266275.1 helix-turn-helix domain-containing protein [Nitrososphaerota archaeon]